MFVSIIKYSRKCSSFYFLIMSQDNTYKICLLFEGQLQRFHKLISNDRIWPSEHSFEVIF